MSYPWSIISSGDFVPGKLEKTDHWHQEKTKLMKFSGTKPATSAWESLSGYRQDLSLFGFPISLDQDNPPSLSGKAIFSPWWMTGDPWETWVISCTHETIWQTCSETSPGECCTLAFCNNYQERDVFSVCRWWQTVFFHGLLKIPFLDWGHSIYEMPRWRKSTSLFTLWTWEKYGLNLN